MPEYQPESTFLFQTQNQSTWWLSSQSRSTMWRSTAQVLWPLPVSTALHADRMSHSVLTSVHRKGEPGEASSPGDWLCQPDGGAAVLGKLPEDALRWEHHERVSGGWVRTVVLLFTSLIHQHRLQLSLLLLLSLNHLHMLRDTPTLPPPHTHTLKQVGEAFGKLEPGILCHSGRLIKS